MFIKFYVDSRFYCSTTGGLWELRASQLAGSGASGKAFFTYMPMPRVRQTVFFVTFGGDKTEVWEKEDSPCPNVEPRLLLLLLLLLLK